MGFDPGERPSWIWNVLGKGRGYRTFYSEDLCYQHSLLLKGIGIEYGCCWPSLAVCDDTYTCGGQSCVSGNRGRRHVSMSGGLARLANANPK